MLRDKEQMGLLVLMGLNLLVYLFVLQSVCSCVDRDQYSMGARATTVSRGSTVQLHTGCDRIPYSACPCCLSSRCIVAKDK